MAHFISTSSGRHTLLSYFICLNVYLSNDKQTFESQISESVCDVINIEQILRHLEEIAPIFCHCDTDILSFFFSPASAENLERELFNDLMKGYNKNVRPMERSGDITKVDIKMTLTNLISLVRTDLTRANELVMGRNSSF